ncbi:Leu/Phe/Val dehydrogenase [Luminiphilus syltensis]|nr:Glu/Leu/Phe/Val dehydrogenase dimerization domain-containing protein [Luminiphilus syltensis]
MSIMNYTSLPDFDHHEEVVRCVDEGSGLRGFIAVHNTNRGPALGGCRMWTYGDEAAALADVLRLSRGQTYKAALANLDIGGGKSVIIGDPRSDKSRDLLLAMGDYVNNLNVSYIIAEDSGTGVADMRVMNERTQWVAGVVEGSEHGGDPSPSTAYGMFVGIKAAVRHRFGSDNLAGMRIAIQGVGNVGYRLGALLYEAGASLYVADVFADNCECAVREFDARVVSVEEIHRTEVDVYSPCALGGAINDRTVMQIKAAVVAGAANNQLSSPLHGNRLQKRGILCVPDYAINAGGIIDIAYERAGGDQEGKRRHLDSISDTLAELFRRADESGRSTARVADELAEERFQKRSEGRHHQI